MKGEHVHRIGEAAFLLLFLVPFVDSPFPDDFDSLRHPVLAALMTVLVLRVVISAARRREFAYRIDPTLTAIAIFVAIHLLSLVKAVNMWESIIPLIRLLVGAGLYAFIVSGYLSRTFALRFGLPAMVITAGLLSVVGLLQAGGTDPFGRDANGQPVATLGNTNYVGAFIAMVLPFVVGMLFTSMGWIKRGMVVAAASLLTVHLVLSGSRGGWVGAAAGIFTLATVCLMVRHPAVAFQRTKVLAAVVLFLTVLLSAGMFMRDSDVVKRLKTVLETSYPTNQVRLETWKATLAMAKGDPVLGAGAGNFAIRFPPFRSPAEFLLSNPSEGAFRTVEDPHNTFLLILGETGLLGVLSFLLILYVVFRRWIYFVRAAPDRDHVLILAGLLSGLVGFLISGLFNSLMGFTTHASYFWIFIGLIELLGNQKPRFRKIYATDWVMACGISLILIGGFMTFLTARSFQAGLERHYASMQLEAGRVEGAVEHLEDSLSLDYNNWRTHDRMGRALFLSGKLKDAEAHWKESLRLHPKHVLSLQGLARVAFEEGQKDRALDLMKRAVRIAPAYHVLHYNLGKMHEKWGEPEEARRAFDRAARLKEGKMDEEVK